MYNVIGGIAKRKMTFFVIFLVIVLNGSSVDCMLERLEKSNSADIQLTLNMYRSFNYMYQDFQQNKPKDYAGYHNNGESNVIPRKAATLLVILFEIFLSMIYSTTFVQEILRKGITGATIDLARTIEFMALFSIQVPYKKILRELRIQLQKDYGNVINVDTFCDDLLQNFTNFGAHMEAIVAITRTIRERKPDDSAIIKYDKVAGESLYNLFAAMLYKGNLRAPIFDIKFQSAEETRAAKIESLFSDSDDNTPSVFNDLFHIMDTKMLEDIGGTYTVGILNPNNEELYSTPSEIENNAKINVLLLYIETLLGIKFGMRIDRHKNDSPVDLEVIDGKLVFVSARTNNFTSAKSSK